MQVVVSLLYDPTRPNVDTRVRAALSRDGVEVYGDHVNMKQLETRSILLLVRILYLGSGDISEPRGLTLGPKIIHRIWIELTVWFVGTPRKQCGQQLSVIYFRDKTRINLLTGMRDHFNKSNAPG